jgi:hypothetical protein
MGVKARDKARAIVVLQGLKESRSKRASREQMLDGKRDHLTSGLVTTNSVAIKGRNP